MSCVIIPIKSNGFLLLNVSSTRIMILILSEWRDFMYGLDKMRSILENKKVVKSIHFKPES